ncbi:hypothetical protein Trydic_g20204 [Trypoxylus dichotomus]
MYKLFVIFSILISCTIRAQDTSICDRQEKCNDCIKQPGCVWCAKPTGDSNYHCKLETQVNITVWCPKNKLTDPERMIAIELDKALDSGKFAEAVQIKPQRIKVRTRRGEETKIQFQYAKAANYPIDLYYMMDLSASMKTHKNKLATLGGKLEKAMRSITSNFRLGFGSFVDKRAMPFTSTAPKRINKPCSDCVRTYSFNNHLSLTDDYHQFSMQVSSANVSGNMDAPEGGFDAIMQAIVCKKQIGWRENARHIIVFSSDAEFHVAGDGKLAGIVEPNDAACHMVNNEYVKGLDLDYPSISQLNQIAKENNINIIFAVVDRGDYVYNVYRTLQENFENSGVGKLDESSSNVVNLVYDNYKKIVDGVRIASNSTSSIEIKYNSSCKYPIENGCSNLQLDEVVNFTAAIKPLECLEGSNFHTVQIKPEGINEALVIELEVVCSCDCEKPNHPDYVPNSTKCNGNGNEVCGICDCRKGHFGSTCECGAKSISYIDDVHCRKDPQLPQICSGLGSCKCGKCVCDERPGYQMIYGKFCECDNFSCRRVKGELCSGPDHGKCDCGKCQCLPGWIGEQCDCRDTISTCIDPKGNGEICSGNGQCVCGECQCTADKKKYSGRYCEECAACPGRWCETLQTCVECQAYGTGLDEPTCLSNCTQFNTTLIETIDATTNDENVKVCTVIDSVGCTITFRYTYLDRVIVSVEALKLKIDCPVPTDPLVVILIVIGSIVLGGLILLAIWKVVTHIHDGREYARFVSEAGNAKWVGGGNPLYKDASTTFHNPTYSNR